MWNTNLKEAPHGVEVLGYHPEWIDEDFNPDGIRPCFRLDDGWTVAVWCNLHDEWHTKNTDEPGGTVEPSHWTPKPEPPQN